MSSPTQEKKENEPLDLREGFSDRLKLVIHDLKMSQHDFAFRIGIGQDTVSRAVTGKSLPTFEVLYKISTALPRINMRWLVCGVGVPYESEPGGANYDVKTVAELLEHKIYLERIIKSMARNLDSMEYAVNAERAYSALLVEYAKQLGKDLPSRQFRGLANKHHNKGQYLTETTHEGENDNG